MIFRFEGYVTRKGFLEGFFDPQSAALEAQVWADFWGNGWGVKSVKLQNDAGKTFANAGLTQSIAIEIQGSSKDNPNRILTQGVIPTLNKFFANVNVRFMPPKSALEQATDVLSSSYFGFSTGILIAGGVVLYLVLGRK